MNLGNCIRRAGLAAIATLCLPLPGFAQRAQVNESSAMQACRADAQKLCASVQPGGGRIVACLRASEAKLSPGCQSQLGKVEACAADLKKLCPRANGETELRQCAKDKRAELSAACRAAAGA